MSDDTKKRKLEHIKIVLEKDVEPDGSVFDKYRLPYKALPNINMEEIDMTFKFFNSNLSFPFVISSMTGGPSKAEVINKNLAIAAEEAKVALGLGSMRVIIKYPDSIPSFQVKKYCPSIPLFANVGIVQLNYGFGIDEFNKIVDSIEADGIFLHINHLQEAIQPNGDTDYKGLLEKLSKIIDKISVPIIAKEVGHGIDKQTAKDLYDIGIDWIDISGVGGTSWAKVEGYRDNLRLGKLFAQVGIPTDEAILDTKQIKGLKIIAGGGIRSGLDIAKSIILGADMATAAKPLLKGALNSPEEVVKELDQLKKELQIAMFAAGVDKISELKKLKFSN